MKRVSRKSSTPQGYVGFRKSVGKFVGILEAYSSQFFGEESSPFNYTGALIIALLAVSMISGVLMLFYYTPSPDSATESVRYYTNHVPLGHLLRATHRAAAELVILAVLFHMFRVWATGRYCGKRSRFWVTGLVALPLIGLIGWAGYILPWDQRAMVLLSWGRDIAYGPDHWAILGWLNPGSIIAWPIFSVTNEADQLLRIFALHIGGALTIFFFLLWHLKRVIPPRVSIPQMAWLGLLFLLLLIAAMLPLEREQLLAFNPYNIPESVQVDFLVTFALIFYPLFGGPILAGMILLVWLILAYLPAFEPSKTPTAVVIEKSCTGCRLCLTDCPYGAIEMVQIPNKRRPEKIREKARVIASNCASCGICVGSCMFDAMELPSLTSDEVAEFIDSSLAVPEETIQERTGEKPYSPFEGIL